MQDDMTPTARNLTTPYKAVAVYYRDSDSVEYIREDVPAVYRRIDALLTLVFNMVDREELIGFKLKGFENFYLRSMHPVGDFVSLVGLLERAITEAGPEVLDQKRRAAYDQARKIALEDSVALTDLPMAVAR